MSRFENFDVETTETTETTILADPVVRRLELDGPTPEQQQLEQLREEHSVHTIQGFGSRLKKKDAMKVGGAGGLYTGDTMVIAGESSMSVNGKTLRQGTPLSFAEGGVAKLAELGGVFNFTVDKQPVFRQLPDGAGGQRLDPTGGFCLSPSHHHDQVWNRNVSEDYEVIQPRDSFSILDTLDMKVERVGEWKGGRIVFAQSAPETFEVDLGGGRSHLYEGRTLITNNLDGSGKWKIIRNAMNTECWNFYIVNLTKQSLSVTHKTGANDRVRQLDALAGALGAGFFGVQEELQQWAKTKLAEADVFGLLAKVWRPKSETETGAPCWSDGQVREVVKFMDLYEDGSVAGQAGVVGGAAPGSVFGFTQAATAYVSHIAAVKQGRSADPLAQWEYLNAGAGYQHTNRMLDVARQHVSVVGS